MKNQVTDKESSKTDKKNPNSKLNSPNERQNLGPDRKFKDEHSSNFSRDRSEVKNDFDDEEDEQ